MQFDVEWLEVATDELASILRGNPQLIRFLVDDANRIDEVLAADPQDVSVSQPDGLLATQVGRLRVLFDLDTALRRVYVASVELSISGQ